MYERFMDRDKTKRYMVGGACVSLVYSKRLSIFLRPERSMEYTGERREY